MQTYHLLLITSMTAVTPTNFRMWLNYDGLHIIIQPAAYFCRLFSIQVQRTLKESLGKKIEGSRTLALKALYKKS